MAKKIVITGANGQLGKELQAAAASHQEMDFIFLTKETLPIDHDEIVAVFFRTQQPDYCINCAAYTSVDKAESESTRAYEVNARSARTLARACAANGTRFIHISTDYVFDGSSSVPLTELSPTAPLNVYGASKLMGEELVLEANPSAIIIRTSWVYSSFGNNFVKTMIRLMQERELISVVNDQIGSPTYAADLASVLLQIIDSGKWIPGIFNYSNLGNTSWFEFAEAIKALIHSSCQVVPIPTSQFPTPAKRPSYSLLDKSKIQSVYGINIPGWKSSLEACIRQVFI